MPNIFGNNAQSYAIFSDAFPQNTPEAVMRQSLTQGGRQIDWDVSLAPQTFRNDAEAITAAYGLVSNNLQAVQAESDEILRRVFQLNEFIPINTNVPEGATSKAINIVNRYGKGKFINKDGSNVEKAQSSVNRVSYPIAYGGVVAEWSLQELRESIFAGIPLDNETIQAAVEGCNYHIQAVGFLGSAEEKFTGLLNNAEVAIYGGTVPNFKTATGDEIVAFVNALITKIGTDSNEVLYQHFRSSDLMMAVPTEVYDILVTTRYGDNADKTLWDFLKKRNSWTSRTGRELMLKSLPEANEAGASNDARLTLYPKDKRVLEMDMPISPRVTRVIDQAYGVQTPYEYSISGLNFKRANLALYADGLLG